MALRRAAHLDTMYQELPLPDRFQAARDDGFDAVELWSWEDRDLAAVRAAADRAGISICCCDGDGPVSLIDPDRREAYLGHLRRSLAAARLLGVPGVTIHSNGLGPDGGVLDPRDDLSHTVKLCALYDGLRASAALAEQAGIDLYLEPLNVTTDHPGNFLRDTRTAAELVRLVGSPRLRVLFDLYHMQLSEGHLCDTIRQYADTFGHVHAADAPGRHEPGTGEIAFPRVYQALEQAGYTGFVSYELFPARSTAEAVAAIRASG